MLFSRLLHNCHTVLMGAGAVGGSVVGGVIGWEASGRPYIPWSESGIQWIPYDPEPETTTHSLEFRLTQTLVCAGIGAWAGSHLGPALGVLVPVIPTRHKVQQLKRRRAGAGKKVP